MFIIRFIMSAIKHLLHQVELEQDRNWSDLSPKEQEDIYNTFFRMSLEDKEEMAKFFEPLMEGGEE